MDFFTAEFIQTNTGLFIQPSFNSRRVKDFMVRGRSFYAVYLEEEGLWSRQESDVYNIVDDALAKKKAEVEAPGPKVTKTYWMNRYRMKDSNASSAYTTWVKGMFDNYRPLDQKVTYLSQKTELKDYASKRLPYDLNDGVPEAYNELMSTLYDPKERRKLEWATGAVLNGDGRYIQKMMVLYGPPGSGKSTFLHILEQLLTGYWTTFDAASLTKSSTSFSTHFFSENPLVAIQHDGQLSKIEDNSLLNSIVSHEDIVVNEKFKAQYVDRANCMLFLGTNSPVKISDSKSGLIRRVIDVNPSGKKVEGARYYDLMDRIPFELGRIANQCIKVYRHFGKRYYDAYRPLSMMYATDVFFNFVADNRLMLENDDPIDLERVYAVYKDYCEKTNASFISQRHKFRDELENYYEAYDKKNKEFSGFKAYLLDEECLEVETEDKAVARWITLDCRSSLLDACLADCPAQYGNKDEIPFEKWENVTRTLKEIDTHKLHYVKVPENHIVIDFDLKNEKGEKDVTLNLEAANKFPPTYAEYSKGGAGIHLHYIYTGSIGDLSRVYDDSGIEVKVFTGGSSLRRKLTLCNNLPIATISSGLPLKEEKKLINFDAIKDEQHLRNCIKKALRKEVHAYTKPSIDYIFKVLEDAYKGGLHYDVRDMRQKVLTFAMKSTNQRDACIKLVNQMRFCSEEASNEILEAKGPIIYLDIECYKNLFLICWKFEDVDDVVAMINPSPKDVGELFKYRIITFNGVRYDQMMLYARYLGQTNEELFKLSQQIINEGKYASFYREAKSIGYCDVWQIATNKQGLKRWEIELDLPHKEMDLDWDEPVDEKDIPRIIEYCKNDVRATEAVFKQNEAEWIAINVLVDVCNSLGIKASTIDTINELVRKIIFGNEKKPLTYYTDLATGKLYTTEDFEYEYKECVLPRA